ncbi:autophagy-related protein 22-like protein [Chytriomyces cf. hyalinus JEL632]|nr:autophagy-related protein 22-like protein [Chytriomyces cf. hyalinus JEL632]
MSEADPEKKTEVVEIPSDAAYKPNAIANPADYMRSVAVVGAFELWSYYLFYNGNNGGGPNSGFAGLVDKMANMHADKNFIEYNATLPADQAFPEDASCGPSTRTCMVGYGSSQMPLVSFILLRTGLAQLVVAFVLISLGGLGDYKLYGRTFLFWSTFVSITLHFCFAFVDVENGSWILSTVLLFFTLLTYNMSLSFFFGAFPRLAKHMPSVYQKIDDGATVKEVDDEIALQRSRISMISTYWSNIGWAVPLLIYLGIIFMLNPDPDAGQTYWTYNASAILFGAYWLVFAVPYFLLDKKREGPEIPAGVNIYTEGLRQAGEALKLAKKLPQVWWYFVGYFLYCDGVNSCGTLLGNLQGQYISYNVLNSNLFNLAQAFSSMLGCLIFWAVQKQFRLPTKVMLQASVVTTILMYSWAIVGLFSKTLGYKSKAEFWFYNIGAGLFYAPFWALQNTYLTDLIPAKKAYLFFGLFGIMSKCSAFVGPLVNFLITAISGGSADYIAFIPCTVISIAGFVIIQYSDPVKGRADVVKFEEEEREREAAALVK